MRRRNPPRDTGDLNRVQGKLRDEAIRLDPRFKDWSVDQRTYSMRKGWGIAIGHIADALSVRLPRVNDIVKEHGPKRLIVVETRGAKYVTAAIGGPENFGWGSWSPYTQILRLKPYWTGPQGRKRYDDYVKLMTKFGHEAEIVPFAQSEEARPDEEEDRSIPENDADPHVIIRHTPQDGTIAVFERNRAIYDVLRQRGLGFVWAPQAKVVRRIGSVGLPKTALPLKFAQSMLHRAGFRVAFEIERAETHEEVQAAHARRREHMHGRADMMKERSLRAAQRAQNYATRAGEGGASVLSKLAIPGYFPTPRELVGRVIGEADIEPGDSVLEPSAGIGSLADGARAMQGEVDTVEIHPQLGTYLQSLGYPVIARDIRQLTVGPIYDRIVMNPPFEDGQDAEHVMHAFKLLKPGGRLVAIMSEGPFFRQYKKDEAFRAWLDTKDHETEKLPPTQFGRATVSTRLVIIDKQAADRESFPLDEAQVATIAQARAGAEGEAARARDIAMELIEKAGTSRRAARSLERAKRLAKEEAQYASDLTSKAANIEALAAKVGVEKPKKVKAPRREAPVTRRSEMQKMIRTGAKRDLGATTTRTDQNGFFLIFGNRSYQVKVRGGPAYSQHNQPEAETIRVWRGGRPWRR